MYSFLSVSSVSITPAAPSVAAGNSLSLTCSATITGRGTPSFMWTGPMSRGPVPGQASMIHSQMCSIWEE